MLVQEGKLLTAFAGRENADCWYKKEECSLLVQEGCQTGKQNGSAGRENANCWCRKAVTQKSRMEMQDERMLTAGAGRESA